MTGPGFGVRDLSLPVNLNAGQSVTFRVLCTPHVRGNMTGRIDVLSSAAGSNLFVTLSGAGVTDASLNSSASALNFGGVAVGTSKVLTVRLAAAGIERHYRFRNFHQPGVSSEWGISTHDDRRRSYCIGLADLHASKQRRSIGNISFAGNSADTLAVETLKGSGKAASLHTVRLQWNPAPSKVKGYNVYRSSTLRAVLTKRSTLW